MLLWIASDQLPECAEHFPLHAESIAASVSNLTLYLMGFTYFVVHPVVTPYFCCYFIGPPSVPRCSDIPYTYFNFWSGCWNDHQSPSTAEELLAFTKRRHYSTPRTKFNLPIPVGYLIVNNVIQVEVGDVGFISVTG